MSQKKSKGGKKEKAGSDSKKMKAASASLGAVVLAVAGFTLLSRKKKPSGPPAPATGSLLETRPILNHKMFSGKAAVAYKIAAEIPKVIDSQFCYCYCKRDHGHKTLLTCYTNTHGSKCEICMNEVLYAYELFKDKYSLDDIVKELDNKFYRPYRRHRI